MNALIDNIEVLKTFYDIQRNPPKYASSYKEIFDLYPDIIKEILKTERSITPKHLTQNLLKELFLKQCRNLESNFKSDVYCDPVIDTITLYLREDPAFLTLAKGYDFNKGLLLRGKVGSGKTLIMRGMTNLLKLFIYKDASNWVTIDTSFQIIESWKISEEFTISGFEVWDKSINGKQYSLQSDIICIDDIGSESIASYYGNTVNIVGSLLMNRYSQFKEKKPVTFITHATSNLDLKNLNAFYGDRVYSRIREMFNDIRLPGTDRR
jgi:DNA replication protein DnaC